MKWFIRIAVALVLVLVVGLGVVYFYRNSLIRSAVESQASSSLGVKTTLGGANLGLFGGTLKLDDLQIASPAGYKADHMFTLGGLDLGVHYGDLRKEPIHVNQITIDKPKAVLEYVDGKFNFQALMDQMGGGGAPPSEKKGEPVKLIIDQLMVKDAAVEVRAPMIPTPITVPIPSIVLKDIGNGEGNKNGAAIKDVVGVTMSALAASAANSPQLKNLSVLEDALKAQAQQVMGKVQKELGQQVQAITGNVAGEINKALEGTGVNVNKTLQGVTGGKDPAKAVEQGLGNLLGGDKKKDKDKK
ncbi:MAG TPA: hypothetical protein VH475_28095 [Tepidisphaeraceae bacterium]